MANQGRAGYTLIDASNEKAVFSMNVGVVTGASLPGLLTNLGAFETAMDAVTLCNIYRKRLQVYDNPGTDPSIPSNQSAQRELRWLVHYHDSQAMFGAEANNFFGEKYTCEVPGADPSLLVAGTDLMNVAAGAGATFKTEFQDCFLAPSGGTLVVDYIELVGRKG